MVNRLADNTNASALPKPYQKSQASLPGFWAKKLGNYIIKGLPEAYKIPLSRNLVNRLSRTFILSEQLFIRRLDLLNDTTSCHSHKSWGRGELVHHSFAPNPFHGQFPKPAAMQPPSSSPTLRQAGRIVGKEESNSSSVSKRRWGGWYAVIPTNLVQSSPGRSMAPTPSWTCSAKATTMSPCTSSTP